MSLLKRCCMAMAVLCCLAAMNACIPGEDYSRKTPTDLIGEWVTDYEEDGLFGEVPYNRVVEHYAFFADNTGYYELFVLNGDQVIGSESLRGTEGRFKYVLLSSGDIGIYQTIGDYWKMKLDKGVLTDPEDLVYHRASEEMVALMSTWADCLTPGKLAEKLMGKWMVADLDGQPALTNRKTVLTFVSPTKAFMSRSFEKPDKGDRIPPKERPDFVPGERPEPKGSIKPGWDDYEEFDVTIQGNLVTLNKLQENDSPLTSVYLILDITDAEFVCDFTLPVPPNGPEGEDGERENKMERQRFERIEANYEEAAIGLWEGKVTSADDEYSDGELHRWEYKTDGTFIYYRQDETGAWVDDVNEYGDYFIDGTLLCTRWKNVGEEEMVEHREWWEIASIEDGVMKWTALRQKEDGTTYTASFEMKAVKVPSQEEIEEMIIGKWMTADYEGKPELTNNKSVITFLSTTEALYSTSRSDYSPTEGKWGDHLEFMVEIDGNKVNTIAAPDEHIMLVNELTIYSITDTEMELTFKHTTLLDGDVIDEDKEHAMRWERITEDYSQAILGVWESDADNEGDVFRCAYLANGTHMFWLKVGDEWQRSEDEFADYFVDGILLCTRWKNVGEGEVEHREWWEITSIEDDVMKWSALRQKEDGTTYIVSYSMTRVPTFG